MKTTRKPEPVGAARQSIWRGMIKLFRHRHDPLLVANLTAFNEPRIYLPPEFSPPLRFVVSQL